MILRSSSSKTIQAAIAACLLLATVALPTSVRADDTTSRLRQLEGSVDTLNRAVFKGEMPAAGSVSSAPSADYQASVETRLGDLENQIRELTGKVEQQEFENSQLKTKLDKALADIELRFQDTGAKPVAQATDAIPMKQSGTLAPNDMGGEVAPPAASGAADVPVAVVPADNPNAPAAQNSPTVQNLGTMSEAPGGATIPPKAGDDPAGQYEMAFSLLKGGNNSAAKNGFEEFIKTYPDHPLVANATYWLGESYYAQGEFEKAARVFAEGYKKYPKSPKVADSLLKMGMSLGGAGKTKEACVTLQQLKKEFPSGEGVTLRRADQEMSKLGCS
jgi:tol-pal system protein YbgF